MRRQCVPRPRRFCSPAYTTPASVAAQLLAQRLGGDRVSVLSAGSHPADRVHPVIAQVLAERGLDTRSHRARLLDAAVVRSSDIVVTMGCGETCPVFPGIAYEDWAIQDPAGQEVAVVRGIVDAIELRVRDLIERLTGEPSK